MNFSLKTAAQFSPGTPEEMGMIREKLIEHGIGVSTRFRLRGLEVSRIEALSDAVFGFAITLLVVSLEVPRKFIASSGKFMEEQGFFEKSIANHVETFGNIVHAFSVYEGRHDTADAKPFVRGINSIQLMNDGQRWWVVTIFWQAEDAANPLPKKYLEAKKK